MSSAEESEALFARTSYVIRSEFPSLAAATVANLYFATVRTTVVKQKAIKRVPVFVCMRTADDQHT